MSIITRAFRDHLGDDSTVTDIVGSKIRRSWVQNESPPYITIIKISDIPEHHMTAAAGLTVSRVQIDCWETSRHKAETLSTAVREALDGRPGGTLGDQNVIVRMLHLDAGPSELDEPPTDEGADGEYRDMMEFLVGYTQSVPTFA
jgi:hypothetical protein